MKTRVLPTASAQELEVAIAESVDLLRRGEIVALPTETVYGLAADALDAIAALKIFEAKERPKFDPLIVHLPNRGWLSRLAEVPPEDATLVGALADQYWPGPLTLILQRTRIVPDVVTAGLATVAVRVSAHPVFAGVVAALARPLAAPSANRFGRISPTTAAHVLTELDGRVPLILDAGATTHGLESTIVAVRSGRMEMLRPGPITIEALRKHGEVEIGQVRGRLEAPGQMRSHYAPRTPLLLLADISSFRAPAHQRCGALYYRTRGEGTFAQSRSLSASGDVREAASNLFRCLRELDDANLDLIVAETIPEHGLGSAIMDRLRRAAAR